MNEKENLVEMTTENAETAAAKKIVGEQVEEISPAEKTYTQAELDDIVGKRLARNTAKIKKEYDRKYGALEEVLRAGTGKQSVEEMTSAFAEFYEKKGIALPKKADYSPRDIEVLAQAEAADIINSGYEEVVEEVDRLSAVGAKNMTEREKAVFKVLAEHRQTVERGKELAKLGVAEDEYTSAEFKAFAEQFNPKTPVTEIYGIYKKLQPKKEIKTIGSMKNSTSENGTVKDFYTRDEALQFTKKDFDKNPALFKAVEASMLKW